MWKVSWFYEKVNNITNFGDYVAILYSYSTIIVDGVTCSDLEHLTFRVKAQNTTIHNFMQVVQYISALGVHVTGYQHDIVHVWK